MTKSRVLDEAPGATSRIESDRGSAWTLLKETFQQWTADNIPTHGAALAYYTVFAVAPLLLITIAIASTIFGSDAASGELFRVVGEWTGDTSAAFLQDMIRNGNATPGAGLLSSLIAGAVLLFGASSVFVQLQTSLNQIWHVETPARNGVWGLIKGRLISFSFVIASGFLLLFSLVITVGISFAGAFMPEIKEGSAMLMQAINVIVSLGIVTVLFALIYRFLPDARIDWRDAWIGAFLTAVLFTIGKSLVGLYLGRSGVGSVFGAAGSLIVFLVWVYYSAQIIFFGAEFTKVYARKIQRRPEGRAS